MRLICLSDTHSEIIDNVPDGDVLIFAGDFSGMGTMMDVLNFKSWLNSLPHRKKICIAGNHDRYLAEYNHIGRLLLESEDTVYLEDSSIIIDGLKFYGSPWSPEFNNWFFMKPRGDEMAKVWAKIPTDTNVLLTHCPPYGILDKNNRHQSCGCWDLAHRIKQLKQLKLHVFGHLHESHGILEKDGVKFVNCSVLDDIYANVFEPIVIEV